MIEIANTRPIRAYFLRDCILLVDYFVYNMLSFFERFAKSRLFVMYQALTMSCQLLQLTRVRREERPVFFTWCFCPFPSLPTAKDYRGRR